MYLKQLTAPSTLPVSQSEAKAHLRVLHTDEDELIDALIEAAVSHLDGRHGVLGRSLITQQWEYRLNCFPLNQCVELPLPPLQTVDAIEYVDSEGVLQSLDSADYTVENGDFMGWVRASYNVTWPTPRNEPNAVRIKFTSGFGSASADVPQAIRQAILLLVGHYYLNREAVTDKPLSEAPMAVQALIAPYKLAVI